MDETLGSCGCTDYHMADCPTRTDFYQTYEDSVGWGVDHDEW